MPLPALRTLGVSKRYGKVQALDSVSLEFYPGEIHAVLGENGAGKSTLMSIIGGFTLPDAGNVERRVGNLEQLAPIPLGQAHEARHNGISLVHQHFTLVENLTVADNLILAALHSGLAVINHASHVQPALDVATSLGWDLHPNEMVYELSVGQKQRIEIIKALRQASDSGSRFPVLILDEPTAVLSPAEVQDLFQVLRGLKEKGMTILLIAHKLAEVLSISDRISVLHKGKLVATAITSETNASQLGAWMSGQVAEDRGETVQARTLSEAVVTVRNLSVLSDRGHEAVRGVSFNIGAGEILGLAGLDGNGQIELAEAICGLRPATGSLHRPTAVYVPPDRRREGLFLNQSVFDNLLAGHRYDSALWFGPILRRRAAIKWAADHIAEFSIKVAGPMSAVSQLSGGNQQKVVVARALAGSPQLVVVMNPTRGLDYVASSFVHDSLVRAAKNGAAVLLISNDTDEVNTIAHRSFVLSRGKLYDSYAAT